MKLLKRLAYITMAFYFVGLVTGGVNSLLMKYKMSCTFVLESEDETSKSRIGQNLVEEDVICHESYFTLGGYVEDTSLNPHYHTIAVLDIALAMIAPPPEQA